MTTMRDDFEAWYRVMFAENPSSPEALTGWLAYQAATERAAKVAQAHLDGEAIGAKCESDWTADMGFDWACQKIRDAIRGGERSKG